MRTCVKNNENMRNPVKIVRQTCLEGGEYLAFNREADGFGLRLTWGANHDDDDDDDDDADNHDDDDDDDDEDDDDWYDDDGIRNWVT